VAARAFEAFLQDIEDLRRAAPPEEMLVTRVASRLQRLNLEARWLPDSARVPCTDGYAQHVVHVAEAGGFSVCSLVWLPGQFTPIHDHVAWCVVGVYEGAERETLYRLEQTEAGQHLDVIHIGEMSAGNAAGFPADGNDLHQVANSTDGLAISIHVYGTDMRALGSSIKNRYDHLPIRRQAPVSA
jgi:predicted metal-dependent enzyme (double-stranded beta helix superfamily)